MESNSLYHPRLRSGDYHPKVNYYYFKQWDDFRMPFHEHNSVEIMYVITGQCQIDVAKSSFALKKGDFILIDANVSHRLIVRSNQPCRMLNIEFVFERKHGLCSLDEAISRWKSQSDYMAFFAGARMSILKDPDEIYHTLKSLVIQLDEHGTDNEMMIQLLLAQIMIRIATIAIEAKNHDQQPSDGYVKNAITYIQHHYDYDIQVKDIAASVNVHPGYLHRIFKASLWLHSYGVSRNHSNGESEDAISTYEYSDFRYCRLCRY